MATYPRLDGRLADQRPPVRQRLVLIEPEELRVLTRIAPKREEESLDRATLVPIRSARMTIRHPRTSAATKKKARAYFDRLRMLKKLGLKVVYADLSEIEGLEFPPGHPQRDYLYMLHPTISSRYLVPAEFHHRVFEDKVAEAIRLASSLGAKKVRIHHVEGWKRGIGASAIQSESHVSIKVAGERSTTHDLLFEAEYTEVQEASLPDDLSWYHSEPMWQELANGRLRSGLKSFALDVSYKQDFGVNAELVDAVRKAGFNLGGEVTKHEATIWRLTVEFATPAC